jgi:hypothetical protein
MTCEQITLDLSAFRTQFPQFSNTACFPDVAVEGWWDTASTIVTTWPNSLFSTTIAQQTQSCNLMAAHIGGIFAAIAQGQPLGVITDAAIDKIRVAVKPPPNPGDSQYQWWLSQTPYGQMLLALLNVITVGGLYVGGLPERAAFRRVGGGFGGVYPGPPSGRPWPR